LLVACKKDLLKRKGAANNGLPAGQAAVAGGLNIVLEKERI
jgi:hypothetical protein